MVTKLDPTRLEALVESAQLLQSSLELDVILKHLLRTVMGRLLARRGLLAVRDTDGVMRVQLARGASALKAGSIYSDEAAQAAGIEKTFAIGAEEPVGLLGLGGISADNATGEELEFLRALLGLAASVISNAQAHETARLANQTLDQRLQELRALLDLGRGLASTLEPEEVARLVGLTLSGRWAVSKYAVIAWKEGQPTISREKGLDVPDPAAWKDRIAALGDAQPATPDLSEALGIPAGSLILPIRSQDTTLGVAICGPRMRGQPYREADLEFGAGLAAQAAVALENAWRFKDTLLRQYMEKELALAAGIQQDLFPKALPEIAGMDIAARNRQARQVGGDYYDALPIAIAACGAAYLFCVVDISGKGLPASLLMANIQATLRALLSRECTLLEVAGKANELLYATTPPNRFATAFLCAVEPATGAFRFVNCGHNAAILLRASGEVEMLDGAGLALGIFPKRTYEELESNLGPGDTLAIYSDGVTEAQNGLEQEYEIDRLVACLKENAHQPAEQIVDCVFSSIDEFAGDAPQYDDITLLVAKRRA
jgi:sigma-B regulation protein RsbU (phosphoserine phosphatase)